MMSDADLHAHQSEWLRDQQRHRIWMELCILVDRLHDLTEHWLEADAELRATHELSCVDPDQLSLPLEGPASGSDFDAF